MIVLSYLQMSFKCITHQNARDESYENQMKEEEPMTNLVPKPGPNPNDLIPLLIYFLK